MVALGPGCFLALLIVWAALWGLIAAKLPITAQFGGDVTMNCFFSSQPTMDLQHLTLTWQKELVGAEPLVVHSYYYGTDQLARQDEAYRNRTWLNPEGLTYGNVSLTLRGVRAQDEGIYHCYVYSELGGAVETIELTVNQTSHILANPPQSATNSTEQRRSWAWLLVACFGAWTLCVIMAMKIFCPPGCEICRHC